MISNKTLIGKMFVTFRGNLKCILIFGCAVSLCLLVSLVTWLSTMKELDNKDGEMFDFRFGDFQIKMYPTGSYIKFEIPHETSDEDEPKLSGRLGINLPKIEPEYSIREDSMRSTWGPDLALELKKHPEQARCHTVTWKTSLGLHLEDCFSFGKAHWYGGPEHLNQHWPVEKLQLKNIAYVPQSFANMGKTDPYWLSSKGISIYVDPQVPLFVDTNNRRDNSICFIASDKAPYRKRQQTVLKYTVCNFGDPRAAHEYAAGNFFDKPRGIPDTRMVEHPIWSTWVRFKKDIDDLKVLEFARDIVRHGFKNSQIEIDDSWETFYGSMRFHKSHFADMKDHISKELKEMGFRITVWVHPFVNLDCPDHRLLNSKHLFVRNDAGSVRTEWWDGPASAVDFTNPDAVKWFQETHRKILTDNGIDGMKFDAGETSWLPQVPVLYSSESTHPRSYTQAYLEAVSVFGPMTEVRVSFRSQKYPMFVRMLDKDSRWDFENGLPTLITTMLMMNIQGYPFVLPDMVGGNAYNGDAIDRELFIRWLQANVFMPSIQFSAAPWDFDDEVVQLSKKFTDLHYEYSKQIIALMEECVRTGAPVNPPIWWIDPKNPTALTINDEYLLGENILVAPVIKKRATSRDIYLPQGFWREGNFPHRMYRGRRWLKSYEADLSTLPYFIRVN